MKVFKSKPKDAPATRAEALNCTPVRNLHVRDIRLNGDEARIDYPVRVRPFFAGLIRHFGGRPGAYFKKLQLDAMGTQVWDMIDGKRTVKQIVHLFA
ncbi:PqqD family protein, partial [Thermodesulfobacteriota bacterium]